MRIIAGQYRRRKLAAVPGKGTRPITDRAKEILFENLGGELHGERVADLFSGTGSLGLEALSRGAASVVFLEREPRACALLRQNIAMLAAEEACLCWRGDFLRCSFRPAIERFAPYDLIFCDPPYRMVQTMQPGSPFERAFRRLAKPEVAHAETRLLLRTPLKSHFTLPAVWQPSWELPISSMMIHAFTRAATLDEEPT